jgi:hypothetical protein
MLITVVQTGIVVASIVGASFGAPVIVDAALSDDAPAVIRRPPRPVVVIDTVAEILGVSRGDVVSTLRTGGTLDELAVEQGSSGDVLAVALREIVEGRIDEALATGRIDEARADELRASAAERIDTLVFEPHRRVGRSGLGGEIRKEFIGVVEDELDLARGPISLHVRTGATLADLADEHGSSGDDLVAAMLAVVDGRLERAVADGHLDEDRAAKLLERAQLRLIGVVFNAHIPDWGR